MVTAWLEISTERLLHVYAHPRDGIAALHPDLTSPENIDAPAASFRSALVQDSGWIAASPPPAPELRAALDPIADRIVRQRTQRFESEVHEFRYGLRSAQGVVKVAGSPAGILPSSDWAPLYFRLALGVSTGFIGLVLALFVRGRYLAQAPWFHHHGNALPLLVFGIIAACAIPLAVTGFWLPARARSKARTLLPTGVCAFSCSMAFALWFVGGPTVTGVDASLERGDLVDARTEAEALTLLGRSPDGLDAALVRLDELEAEERRLQEAREDDEHFERVESAASLPAAVAELDLVWHTDRLIADARAVVVERATQEMEVSFGTEDEAALQAVADAIGPVDDDLAQRARSRGLLARASTCRRAASFDCAVNALRAWKAVAGDSDASRKHDEVRAALVNDLAAAVAKVGLDDADLETRAASIRSALADANLYETLVDEPAPRSAATLRALLTTTEASLAREHAKQEAAARKVEAAVEKKRVADEKRAAAAERRWRKAAAAEPADRGCCKYCSKGKPCGDSCIARNKQCHKGSGCAC